MPKLSPGDTAKLANTDGLIPVHAADLNRWQEELHNAFDLGFKAAGGTTIPDGARDMVELALTREQINVLADCAESLSAEDHWPALEQFLETVSIYRSKPHA